MLRNRPQSYHTSWDPCRTCAPGHASNSFTLYLTVWDILLWMNRNKCKLCWMCSGVWIAHTECNQCAAGSDIPRLPIQLSCQYKMQVDPHKSGVPPVWSAFCWSRYWSQYQLHCRLFDSRRRQWSICKYRITRNGEVHWQYLLLFSVLKGNCFLVKKMFWFHVFKIFENCLIFNCAQNSF
jgi:hypothetical protein